MDLGDIVWRVKAETDDLSRAQGEMSSTGDHARRAGRATDELGRQVENAGRRTRTATSQMEQQFNKLHRSVTNIHGALIKWGSIISGLATGAFAMFVRRSMNLIDEQAKLARGLGGTTIALQALDRAAGRAGVSSGELQSATLRLSQRLGQAVIEGGAAADALARIGLNAQQLIALDIDERMALLADRMREAGLNSQQMAYTLRELGIRQSAIVNLMQEGGDAIRASRTAIEELGAAVNDVDAAAVERANDAIAELGIIWQGIGNHLAVHFAPILEEIANRISGMVREAGGFGNVISSGMRVAIEAIGRLADWIHQVRTGAAAVEAGITRLDWQMALIANNIWDVFGRVFDQIITGMNFVINELNRMPGIQIPALDRFTDGEFMAGVEANTRKAADAAHEAAWAYHELYHAALPSERIAEFFEAVERRRQEAMENGGNVVGFLGAEFDDLDDKTKKTKKSTDELGEAYRRLRDRIRPVEASQRRYAEEKLVLIEYAIRERMEVEELSALLRDLELDYQNAADAAQVYGFTGKRATEKVKDELDIFAEVGRSTIQRLDDGFHSLWQGFIDGSANAMDTVKRFMQQTLAELAHMLFTRRLTLSIAGSVTGAGDLFGAQGGGQGGLGLLGTVRNMFGGNSIGEGLSGLNLPGGIFSGAGAHANWMYGAAGLLGGLGGSMLGGQGGVGGGLGATLGMALGGPLGALAGGVGGSLLGSLFGRGKSSPALQLSTAARPGDVRWEHHGSAYEVGAFGAVGFADSGTRRLNESFDGKANEFLQAVVASDNLLASLARSPEELDRMAKAVQGVTLRAGSAQGIIDQLGSRTLAAVNVMDSSFAKVLKSSGASSEEMIQRVEVAAQATQLLGYYAEELGLRFNQSAESALLAADHMVQLHGSLETLAEVTERYYMLTYSEAERQERTLNAASKALQQFTSDTGRVVNNAEDLRKLVESLDLNTEAGRELYAQAMSLVPAIELVEESFLAARQEAENLAAAAKNELQDAWRAFERDSLRIQAELLELAGDVQGALTLARERELAAMDEALRPIQQRVWALQDEAAVVQEYNRELARAQNELGGVLDRIRGFVDQARAGQGTPSENLEETERQFWAEYAKALEGDRNALQNITQYAERYMRTGQEYYASSEGFQSIQESVLSALEQLPELLSPEQFIADELRQAAEAAQGKLEQLQSIALSELAELQALHHNTKQQVSALVKIDDSVLSVRSAVKEVERAISNLSNYTGPVRAFADGGVFTNGIVDEATPFSMAVMGEAGPEAVVPLSRGRGGRLGIDASGMGQHEVVAAVKDLQGEVKALRQENAALQRQLNDSVVSQGNRAEQQRRAQLTEAQAQTRAMRQREKRRTT